jgi:hypothetical protein
MPKFEVNSYQASLNFKGSQQRESDFSALGDPKRALAAAKKWLEAEARAHFAKNPPKAGTQELAGSILAVSADEGPAGEPTASLFVDARGPGKVTYDWDG